MTFRIKETPYPICDVYLTYQLEYWQRHEFRSFGRYIEISMIFIKKKLREKKRKMALFHTRYSRLLWFVCYSYYTRSTSTAFEQIFVK